MTFSRAGSSISMRANMPGNSFPSGLSITARTRMLRVSRSTCGSIALMVPRNACPGQESTCTDTGCFTRRLLNCCCGTGKSTTIWSLASSRTIGSPGSMYWPISTWRMPSRPANGARIDFCVIFSRRSSSAAFARCRSVSRTSRSNAETSFSLISSRARVRLISASFRSATSPSSCACSSAEYCWTSRSPAATELPDSKCMAVIWPATCAVTSTPRDARSEPTAGIAGVHDSEVAVVVETVTGGNGVAAMAACIWPFTYAFQPKSAPKNSPVATSM